MQLGKGPLMEFGFLLKKKIKLGASRRVNGEVLGVFVFSVEEEAGLHGIFSFLVAL